MAVIIREERILDGKQFGDVKVYKSDKFPITSSDEKKAERLDEFLANFFRSLGNEVKENKLVNLKKGPGVIKLWYFVGEKLKFIDDPSLVDPSDKKYIWKALWYHAGELMPGEAKTRAGTLRDHFLYCYRLAKFDFDFVMSAGRWRDWMDFFDSPTLSNSIVLEWFQQKSHSIIKPGTKYWLRDFIKLIRNEFENVDMTFLKREEIIRKLDYHVNQFLASKVIDKSNK